MFFFHRLFHFYVGCFCLLSSAASETEIVNTFDIMSSASQVTFRRECFVDMRRTKNNNSNKIEHNNDFSNLKYKRILISSMIALNRRLFVYLKIFFFRFRSHSSIAENNIFGAIFKWHHAVCV